MRSLCKGIATLAVVIAGVLAASAFSFAETRDFIPRISYYGADLDVYFRRQSDKTKVDGNSSVTADTLFTEKLRLDTEGFVYHPNFITFTLGLAGGLRHEDSEGFSGSSGWGTGASEEYDLKVYVLPTHPYSLEVYSSRKIPLDTITLTGGRTPVTYSNGAVLNYFVKTLILTLRYDLTNTSDGRTSSDSENYSATASYSIGPFSSTAGGAHYDTDNSSFGKIRRDQYYLTNIFDIPLFDVKKRLRLESYLNGQKTDEKPFEVFAPSAISSDSFSWREDLHVELPWNFSSRLYYSLYKYSSEFGASGTPETKNTDNTRTASFALYHKLFNSLTSSYTLSHISSHFSQGENTLLTNNLAVNYTKKIPTGNLLMGANFIDAVSDRKGTVVTLNEGHTAPIGGSFLLGGQGIDDSTIVVRVLSVVNPPDIPALIELQRGIHYTVSPVGNSFLIGINSLPSSVCQTAECLNNPLFPYTFQISYALQSGSVKFDLVGYGYNVQLNLLNGFLSPYFNYSRNTQHVLSGALPGGPEDSTSIVTGVALYKRPFRLSGEYRDFTSNINPYTSWKTELYYSQDLTETATLNSRVQYTETRYPMGVVSATIIGYTEKNLIADLKFQKRFPEQRLTFSTGFSYTHSASVSTTNAYSADAGLTWVLGRFEISASANASISNNESSLGRTERIHQFYYTRIKRHLF